MHDRASRELARQWDPRDPLARFRKQFHRPAGQIYLDGNSLGLCSQEAERALLRELAAWKMKASEGWNGGEESWRSIGERLAARIAPLVGAAADEVAIAGSSAVNLHQLVATIYRRQFHRPRILIDGFSSASDRAVLRSQLESRGLDPQSQLRVLQPNDDRLLEEGGIEAALADPTVQMALLPTVVGATGQLLDVARICRAARRSGVVLGLDLSHSLGVMPHALDQWEADFAIWGHHYFTHAGPGAAAGFYLNRRHFNEAGGIKPGLGAGGQEREDWDDLFSERSGGGGAASLQISSSSILSLAPLGGALRLIEDAGLERLRAKSLDLTQFLRCAIEGEIPTLDIVTPKESARRGGHLALLHPAAREICEQLRLHGVSAGFRRPDLICLAPAPLHTSFVECWDAVQILRRIVESKVDAACASVPELVS